MSYPQSTMQIASGNMFCTSVARQAILEELEDVAVAPEGLAYLASRAYSGFSSGYIRDDSSSTLVEW